MIAAVMHAIALFVSAHLAYPAAPLDRLGVAVLAAAAGETERVPAELLIAIAEHESDLRPGAVSWRRADGRRVDKVVENPVEIPDGVAACGLVQTVARGRAACARLLVPGLGIAAGVAELEAELAACRGVMACALAIYAGGRAGRLAWEAGETTDATRFAALFAARAHALGWRARKPGS